jgi:hypothetical protein
MVPTHAISAPKEASGSVMLENMEGAGLCVKISSGEKTGLPLHCM